MITTFRVWSIKDKTMSNFGKLTIDIGNGNWKYHSDVFSVDNKSGILLLGTSVFIYTDDALQRIFEGDVIRVSDSDLVVVIRDKYTSGFRTTPRIKYCDWGWNETVTDHTDRIEILGNIYQNEELIYKHEIDMRDGN